MGNTRGTMEAELQSGERTNVPQVPATLPSQTSTQRNGKMDQATQAVIRGSEEGTMESKNKDCDKSGDSSSESVCLKRELGLVEGVAMIMGIVIGSGIFVSPTGVIYSARSVGLSLVVWAVSGALCTIGALCYAELGTMIPESGGMYSYLHESFGPLVAFLSFWVTVFVRNGAGLAAIALTFSSYFVQAVMTGCNVASDIPVKLLAMALLGLHTWVNCVNVRWAAKVQNVFTASKVVAVTVIIVTGAVYLGTGHTENYQHPFDGTDWSASAIAAAFYQCIFSYGGWENLFYVVEEIKNPSRNLPLSILTSMSLITLVYTLTNAAYLAVLTPDEMVASEAVALTFGHRVLGVMAWIMPVFVMCSTFGSVNGCVFTQARLIYAGAKRQQFPEAFALIHIKNFTPVPSILLNGVLTLVMLASSDVLQLIQYSTYSGTLTTVGCICSLLWLRYKQPHRTRPYKVYLLMPVLFALTFLMLLALPIIYDPVTVALSLVLIATGLPVYYIAIYREDIAAKCSCITDKLTYCCQMVFLCVPEKKDV